MRHEFESVLYIGIGARSHYFTLRQTEERWVRADQREVWSYHIQNLSQNAGEAMKKAQAYADMQGMRLTSTLEGIEGDLQKIKRATAEEIAEREKQEAMWQARREQEQEELRQAVIAKLKRGQFAFGRMNGIRFVDAGCGYITWISKQVDSDNDWLVLTAQEVIKQVPHMIISFEKDLHIGVEGKRQDFNVKVFRINSYVGYYGTVFITTLLDLETNACLVVKSASFCPDVDSVLKIKATVKAHDEYNGQAQTVLQRVKVL